MAENLIFSFLLDAAGVEKKQVGAVHISRRFEAERFQIRLHTFGVRVIHLATKGLNVVSWHPLLFIAQRMIGIGALKGNRDSEQEQMMSDALAKTNQQVPFNTFSKVLAAFGNESTPTELGGDCRVQVRHLVNNLSELTMPPKVVTDSVRQHHFAIRQIIEDKIFLLDPSLMSDPINITKVFRGKLFRTVKVGAPYSVDGRGTQIRVSPSKQSDFMVRADYPKSVDGRLPKPREFQMSLNQVDAMPPDNDPYFALLQDNSLVLRMPPKSNGRVSRLGIPLEPNENGLYVGDLGVNFLKHDMPGYDSALMEIYESLDVDIARIVDYMRRAKDLFWKEINAIKAGKKPMPEHPLKEAA